MRKLTTALLFALMAGACSSDTTGPADDSAARLDDMAVLGYGAMQVGAAGAGDDLMARLAQLPPELALTADQAARITVLINDFVAATTADREALAAIHRQVVEARRNDAPTDELRARGAEIRARLHQSERALRDAVLALLTPAQRAALTGRTHEPREPRCTDAQRTEISGLLAAFEQTNAADIAIVRSAHERAHAARASGATREQVAAILAEARDALNRLQTARTALRAAIQAVGCQAR